MKKIPSSTAQNNFGELLDTAQREPVTIEKRGRPVAVVISMKEYHASEALKLAALQRDLQVGIDQIEAGQLVDGDQVFDELLSERKKKS